VYPSFDIKVSLKVSLCFILLTNQKTANGNIIITAGKSSNYLGYNNYYRKEFVKKIIGVDFVRYET